MKKQPTPTPNIMVVDDEQHLCKSLKYLLKTSGYEVMTASCGKEALALMADRIFDLVIVDVNLPDIKGTEIMTASRRLSPDTIVIVITGDANIDSALAALKCGAYDYLRKPFEFEELVKTVENALNQKQLKREKEKANKKLGLSEKKYRYLVQNSPDIIYTLDANGNFTFLSEAVEHMLGFTIDGLIGSHYSTIVCDEDHEKAQWFFDERRSRKRASTGVELRLKMVADAMQKPGDAQYLTVELKSMGIVEDTSADGQKRHIGTHGVIRDISERQRLQAQLQNADRMESLGTLAGGIAHDFNNLLMGIQGRSSLIAMELKEDHPHFEHLQAIEEYISSAKDLTKQLLGFARGGKYEVKPTDINGLVDNSVKMFGRTRKEIIIETDLAPESICVEADRRQIEQVLLNLYVNAWQAMPDGGSLSLQTESIALNAGAGKSLQLEPGRYARISVTDTGIGMDAKTLQRIFDPFFTTKEKSRGTGLGLASAYGIIKNHGGVINARSKAGHGTTFTIHLPITEEAVVTDSVREQKISAGFETVLLVDDEEMILEVGQAMLEKLGYRVIAVNNGEDAAHTVQRLRAGIDLVILDMIMPGLDGGKTFDRIREACPQMPVMLSSGYTINGQAERIMNRGCNGFIQKPYNFSEISEKIRQILDGVKP